MYCLCLVLALFFGKLSAEMRCEEARQKLIEGNQRFVNDSSVHPDRVSERRLETAGKQEPFAVILGCSDSRVAPEIIFDQGIGDLFIVRVAGNVVGPVELDSIEYSAIYLHSCLIVVLGHENCGAVDNVLKGNTKDIEAVATLIEPAVKKTKGQGKDRLENTIKANVQMVVEQLKQSKALSQLIEKKKIDIVGGYYNFHTGQVEFF
jgi:carbonic anhydrase